MPIGTTPFDAAAYLNSEEQIADYLEVVFEEGEPAGIAMALRNVARARNMATIASDSALTLETLTAMVRALGFKLSIKPV